MDHHIGLDFTYTFVRVRFIYSVICKTFPHCEVCCHRKNLSFHIKLLLVLECVERLMHNNLLQGNFVMLTEFNAFVWKQNIKVQVFVVFYPVSTYQLKIPIWNGLRMINVTLILFLQVNNIFDCPQKHFLLSKQQQPFMPKAFRLKTNIFSSSVHYDSYRMHPWMR